MVRTGMYLKRKLIKTARRVAAAVAHVKSDGSGLWGSSWLLSEAFARPEIFPETGSGIPTATQTGKSLWLKAEQRLAWGAAVRSFILSWRTRCRV